MLPDFKGERAAPPPIYAPVAGEKVCSPATWVSHGSTKAKPGLLQRQEPGFFWRRGKGLWLHSLASRGAVRISAPVAVKIGKLSME
ncbi:hypothetical protein BBD41_13145 [Paenibacillus ihbetae]|uniref:Uncharacterized protein n=1 Tax=Paenibacillus ihbetae TaxID=1870820 RepID=A0A1B2E0H2_9BACL|nr:hypothetical protein BBD41_13145 [Paenibacillus ihbetae]